jgi:hypothetical protein
MVFSPADPLRNWPGYGRPELSLDLAGSQESPAPGIDGQKPVRVNRAPILPFLLERARGELLNNASQEVLVEPHLGYGPGAMSRQVEQEKASSHAQTEISSMHSCHLSHRLAGRASKRGTVPNGPNDGSVSDIAIGSGISGSFLPARKRSDQRNWPLASRSPRPRWTRGVDEQTIAGDVFPGEKLEGLPESAASQMNAYGAAR